MVKLKIIKRIKKYFQIKKMDISHILNDNNLGLISSLGKIPLDQNENIECEIRFGEYKNSKFISNIGIGNFERIKKLFKMNHNLKR